SGSGFTTITWLVSGAGTASIPVTMLDMSNLRVSFPAPRPGPYTIDAQVKRGSMICSVQPQTVNVGAGSGQTLQVRLRYVPLPGRGAPPQLDPTPVTIPGGADYTLPAERTLDAGRAVMGTIAGPGGVKLAAYLRVALTSGDAFELFADSLGRF